MFEENIFSKNVSKCGAQIGSKNRKHQIELMQWHYFLKCETILGFQHFSSLTIQ